MGSSIPSTRLSFHLEIERWREFRGALTEREKEVFDDMVQSAFRHASKAANCPRPTAFEQFVMCTLFEHELGLRELRGEPVMRNPEARLLDEWAGFVGAARGDEERVAGEMLSTGLNGKFHFLKILLNQHERLLYENGNQGSDRNTQRKICVA